MPNRSVESMDPSSPMGVSASSPHHRPGIEPHPPLLLSHDKRRSPRDKDHRPAEMVHVSDAWPILSKDIAFTARDQMRKSDVTPEHVARRLVDHHDSGQEGEYDGKRGQCKGSIKIGRLIATEASHDPDSFWGAMGNGLNSGGNGVGPCSECLRLRNLLKEASSKSFKGNSHLEAVESRLKQAAEKNEYMRGIIVNYQKIIDDLRRSQGSHQKTLFETRKGASKAFKEQEMAIRGRVDAARKEGQLEAKMARDRELEAVARHAAELAEMREETDNLKLEILKLKRIIENLELQIPKQAQVDAKATLEWQQNQRIKVQSAKIESLQAERDALQVDRDDRLHSLKALMDHKEEIEEQLTHFKKRSNDFFSEIKDLQDDKERYLGLVKDAYSNHKDAQKHIEELEFAARAKDQALQGFRELAENWQYANSADVADASRLLVAAGKEQNAPPTSSTKRGNSGIRVGAGVWNTADHGIEKPTHVFEATSRVIRTPGRPTYVDKGNWDLLGATDAQRERELEKMSEKELQKRAKYNEAKRVLNDLNRQSEDSHNKLSMQAIQGRAKIHSDYASLFGPKVVSGSNVLRRSSDKLLSLSDLPTTLKSPTSVAPIMGHTLHGARHHNDESAASSPVNPATLHPDAAGATPRKSRFSVVQKPAADDREQIDSPISSWASSPRRTH